MAALYMISVTVIELCMSASVSIGYRNQFIEYVFRSTNPQVVDVNAKRR